MGLINKVRDFLYYNAEEQAAKVPSEWRKRRRWNSTPVHYTDEALLILAKSLLTEAQRIADDAAQYPEGSAVRRNALEYIRILMAMLRSTTMGFERLMNTPLGDHAMMDTLALVKERYQLMLEEIEGG